MNLRKKITPLRILGMLIAVVVIFAVVMPYLWMLLTSFKSTPEIMKNPDKILPIHWSINGYIKVLTRSPFFIWFTNSLLVSVSVTLLVLLTSSLTGYIFAKYQFRLKNLLFWLILASMMVPFSVTMIPNFLIVNKLGLYDSLAALIVPMMVSGFGIFLCRQFCEDIPDSICEAAKIDGAGDFRIYFTIILPLLRPCLAALAIFTFLESWNDYLRPLIMLEKVDSMTLPVALSFFSTQHGNDLSATMAAAALVMMPVTIVFLVFQKHFIKGIALTGSK
ncbi:carbohydrate ABC transporter permease [Anoxybacterium hadale]|uniref:Carbohydrate ABC transporter permease n=1 Tax=Anoxybacterium hadale TaxID=3408580 RepID=A0ACD1AFH3_9FIRM|nr:carbohydrate ABC transporter permease [Clostridiales bacterium]